MPRNQSVLSINHDATGHDTGFLRHRGSCEGDDNMSFDDSLKYWVRSLVDRQLGGTVSMPVNIGLKELKSGRRDITRVDD